MMVICVKQHLSNTWSSIHEKVKQHLSKISVAYKKSMYFPVKSARQRKMLHSLKQESKTKQCETNNSKLYLLQMVKGTKVKQNHNYKPYALQQPGFIELGYKLATFMFSF